MGNSNTIDLIFVGDINKDNFIETLEKLIKYITYY